MERKSFLNITAVALAAQGFLPLLADTDDDKKTRRRLEKRKEKIAEIKANKKNKGNKTGFGPDHNIFTEPPAIEPVTGYLPEFKPLEKGTMNKKFSAKYQLVLCMGAKEVSRNKVSGSLDISFSDSKFKTEEQRHVVKNKLYDKKLELTNVVKTELQCQGKFNTISKWTLDSSIKGSKDLSFEEKGTWDGTNMVVKSKTWTQKHSTTNPLIGRWALLPLLSAGKIKSKPLTFDMLDDSALRPNQTLRYCGEIEIPVGGGKTKLDCYSQTGQGIVPTHYLVDKDGRVQLITQSMVNWALSALK